MPVKALFTASVALLAFATLTGLALLAWFARAEDPWTWKGILAFACAVLALGVSALVWRKPSHASLLAGIAVMIVSLARVGPLAEWTWASGALVVITLGLMAPLVHALLLLPRG